MKRILAPGVNCWQAFLACMLDCDLNYVHACSTTRNDWKENTETELANAELFYVEVAPGLVSQLPDGALVGAHINGISKPHIVIAKCFRDGPRHFFKVEHDPSGSRKPGTPISPSRIVLLCKLDTK